MTADIVTGDIGTADPLLIRAAALYVPLAVVVGVAAWRQPSRRALAGVLLGGLWNLVALFAVHLIAISASWWAYSADGGMLHGFPVDLWIGWALLWGVAAPLAMPRAPLVGVVALAVWLDLLLMPRLAPVLQLGDGWLRGEALAAVAALIPGLLLARWTERDVRLVPRVVLQVLLAGGLMLGMIPAVALARGGSSDLELSQWQLLLIVQLVALCSIPALSAVQEFARRGRGTPIPYDPPRRLVVTGPYAYLANPMQLCAVLLLALSAVVLRNAYLAAAPVLAIAYSVGLARWHEGEDLRQRFGTAWVAYRAEVHNWRPRLRPYVPPGSPAQLYIASSCEPCSEVGGWFARQHPRGLALLPAEEAPPELRLVAGHPSSLRRITYVGVDGSVEQGLRAVARGLEHIHLGWAALAWTLRLPVIAQFAQLVADASGAGPRELPARPAAVRAAG